MKKKILVIITLLLCICFAYRFSPRITNVKADPGFDSSWDSGSSWDSSSSWSSDSDWGSSSSSSSGGGSISFNGSGENSVLFSVIVILPIVITIIVVIITLIDHSMSFSSNASDIGGPQKVSDFPKLSEEEINNKLGDKFDYQKFKKLLFEIFKKESIAYMNKDDSSLKELLDDEIYNVTKAHINYTLGKNKKNIIEDIKYVDSYISSIKTDLNIVEISSVIYVKLKDYIIDVKTNDVLNGDSNTQLFKKYNLVLICFKDNYNNISDYKIKNRTPVHDDNNFISDAEVISILGDDFSVEEFKDELFDLYKEICIHWSNNDSDSLKGLLSDEMYNMYKTQIMTMVNKHERNVMEDITYISSNITKVSNEDDCITITSMLRITCKDYMINETTNEVTRGNKNFINDYTYTITVIKDKLDNEINKCPNCGSELGDKVTTKCPYCRSVIVQKSSKYVMTQKSMLMQKVK